MKLSDAARRFVARQGYIIFAEEDCRVYLQRGWTRPVRPGLVCLTVEETMLWFDNLDKIYNHYYRLGERHFNTCQPTPPGYDRWIEYWQHAYEEGRLAAAERRRHEQGYVAKANSSDGEVTDEHDAVGGPSAGRQT